MVLRTQRDFELAIQKLEAELQNLKSYSQQTKFNPLEYYTKTKVDQITESLANTIANVQQAPIKPETLDSIPSGSGILHLLRHTFKTGLEFFGELLCYSDLTVEGIFTANGAANFNDPVQFIDTVLFQQDATFDNDAIFNQDIKVGASAGVTNTIFLNISGVNLQYKDHAGTNQTQTVVTAVAISPNSFSKGVKTL
jgi:hypothetical protein